MALTQQRDFLSQITPFNYLAESVLTDLANSMDVIYSPEHSKVDLTNADSLFVVIKGKVAELQQGAVVSHYSVRGFFGDAEILGKASVVSVYEVVEEAIFYKLPATKFLQAFQLNSQFANFFNASIVEKLNRIHQSLQSATSTEVMMDTVCSAHIQDYVSVNENASLLAVAKKMSTARSDACVVEFDDSSYGIVTTADILKFLANQPTELLDSSGVLQQVANKPVHTVHEFDYLFNALLKMTRYQIDRLVVRSDSGFSGFLHQKDLMSLFANQSGLALLKVDQAETIDGLLEIGPQIDQLVHNLNNKGIKTHYIAKLVNELHRKMIYKVIDFLLPENLKDKVCIFVMGSEGRSEQVIRTDQDNALLFSNDFDKDQLEQLDQFALVFNQTMQQIGFPPCPGNIMLSNPEWRLSQQEFANKVTGWFKNPSDESFMYAAILFDAEAVYGEKSWLEQLKTTLNNCQQDYPVFLRHFAIGALRFNTPIGFFGGFVTDSETDNKEDFIDIKKGGIFPIVHGIRCYALEAGIQQTNTHWRIKALMDKGVFKEEFGVELGETLNYLNTLRLESMLKQLSEGDVLPDNNIRLSDLSHMQQDILKQSFTVVDAFKKRIIQHFRLDGML